MLANVATVLLCLSLHQIHLSSAVVDVCSQAYSSSGAVCSCTPAYDCRNKALKVVPAGFTNTQATVMYLQNNKLVSIEQMPFNRLRSLDTINLSFNYISYIRDGTFDGLMKLRVLLLNNNRLASIGAELVRHLPGVTELNLSDNLITTIDRHAFFSLPSLSILNIRSLSLECDCEARLLRTFFQEAYPSGTIEVVGATCRNLNQVDFMSVPLSQFPVCPTDEMLFEERASCHICNGAAGTRDCAIRGVERSCSNQNAVCYNLLTYTSNHLAVSGGCISYRDCRSNEQRNKNNCKEGSIVSCYFCTPESLSNYRDVVNSTKEFDLSVMILLNAAFTPGLLDTDSLEYNNFVRNIPTDVQNYLYNQYGSFKVQFIDLRSPAITVNLNVHVATIWFVSKQQVINAIKEKLFSIRSISGKSITSEDSITITELGNKSAQCNSETQYDDNRGTFMWPATNAASAVTIPCPHQLLSMGSDIRYASRLCEMQSDLTARWAIASIGDCPYADKSSQAVENIANTVIDDGNVEDVAAELSSLSNQWHTFESDHVTWTTDAIDGILNTGLSATSRSVIGNTVDIVDNMLNINQDIITRSQEESDSSKRLIEGADKLFDNTDVNTEDYVAIKSNLAGVVTKVDSANFNGVRIAYSGNEQPLYNTQMNYRHTDEQLENGQSGIILPQTMLMSLPATQKNGVKKVTVSVYKDPKLFEAIRKPIPLASNDVISDDVSKPVTRKVNSNVISASVPNVEIKDLDTPVKITFHHKSKGENASCVYWNPTVSDWRSDGCVRNRTGDGFSECHCNHLTNFALLMDVYSTGGDLDEANKLALAIISYIGCGVSFVAICFTLLTYICFRKLRRDNPSKILMNLCVAIGFVDIIFVAGMQTYTSKSEVACKGVAALLHYFLLAAFCWMAVEAYYMYLSLVKVFDTYIARFQLKSSLFGWGIPLVIVIVTLCVNTTDNYGVQAAELCWLERIPFFASFLGPVVLVLVLNTISYILVIKQIRDRGSKKLTKSDKSNTSVKLRGAIALLILLGLTWLFAFFAIGQAAIVFHYLFAILNTMQGLFIFIFYCFLKKEAQHCWRKSLPCFKSPYEKGISKTTDSKEKEPLQKEIELDSSTFDSGRTTKTTVSSQQQANGRDGTRKPQPKYEVDTSSAAAFRGRWQFNVKEDKRPTSTTFA